MDNIQAAFADVYENVERRLGNKAWILPIAVALGAFLVQKKFMHRSTGKALMSGAMTGITAAGMVGAGKAAAHHQ
jgi:hypothetical protein